MKLSKQERIGAVIITVIVIILVGIFVFIKPRFEAIGTARMSYENKQAELTAAQEKAATKNDLRESVIIPLLRTARLLSAIREPKGCRPIAQSKRENASAREPSH